MQSSENPENHTDLKNKLNEYAKSVLDALSEIETMPTAQKLCETICFTFKMLKKVGIYAFGPNSNTGKIIEGLPDVPSISDGDLSKAYYASIHKLLTDLLRMQIYNTLMKCKAGNVPVKEAEEMCKALVDHEIMQGAIVGETQTDFLDMIGKIRTKGYKYVQLQCIDGIKRFAPTADVVANFKIIRRMHWIAVALSAIQLLAVAQYISNDPEDKEIDGDGGAIPLEHFCKGVVALHKKKIYKLLFLFVVRVAGIPAEKIIRLYLLDKQQDTKNTVVLLDKNNTQILKLDITKIGSNESSAIILAFIALGVEAGVLPTKVGEKCISKYDIKRANDRTFVLNDFVLEE